MNDEELRSSWIALYQEILEKFRTIRSEKELSNYPISQETENLMYLSEKTVEFTLYSLESDNAE